MRETEKAKRKPPASDRVPRPLYRWAPVGIAVLALLVRLIYLAGARQSPLFDNLGLDARFYDLWARRIAAGGWIGSDVFFMGPLYPYFLAVLYSLGLRTVFQVAVFQAAVDAVTCGLIVITARRIWSRQSAGWIAGLLACFYGPMMLYTGELLFPTLAMLVHVMFLYLVLRYEEEGRDRLLFLSGIVLGIAAFGKATVLVFYPAVVLWWLVGPRRRAFRSVLRPALILLAGTALVVLPVTARNRIVGHDWVLLTSNGGLNFYIGNNPSSSGAYLRPAGLDVMEDPEGQGIAEGAWGRTLKPSEVSAYWFSRAGSFVREHPGRFVEGLVKKTAYFWGAFEIPQIEGFEFQKRYSPLLRLPFPAFGWIVPLALVGLVLGAERRRWAVLPFLMAVVYSAAIAVFFVTGRYRMAVVPHLIILAAGGILYWVGGWRNARRAALGLAVFVAGAALAYWNPYHVDRKSGFAEYEYRLGLNLEKAGQMDEASAHYRAALALEPFHPGARLNLGVILSRTGDPEEGRALLETLAERQPENAKAHYNLGVALAELGRYGEAKEAYARALAVDPAYVQARQGYGVECYRGGEMEEAGRALEWVAARAGNSEDEVWAAESRFLLERIREDGRARGDDGDLGRAVRGADIRAMNGDWAGAAGEYLRSVEIHASPEAYFGAATAAYNLGELDRALELVSQCVRLDRRFPGANFLMGTIYARMENFDAALAANERERDISPGMAEVYFRLGLLYENYSKDLDAALAAYEKYLSLGGPRADLVRARIAALKAGQAAPGEAGHAE